MIDQAALAFLPKGKFDELHALFSLEVDRNRGRVGTIKGYAKLWGWSRDRTRRFIDNLDSSKGLSRAGNRILPKPVHTINGNTSGLHSTSYPSVTLKSGLSRDRGVRQYTRPTPDNTPGGHYYKKETETKKKQKIQSAFTASADEVIDYLNVRAGKSFKYSESSRKPIIARLKSGATIEDCRTVIDNKVADYDFSHKYLRPSTLFREANFENYLNENPGMQIPGGKTKQENNNAIQQIRTKIEGATGFDPNRILEGGNSCSNGNQVSGSLPLLGSHRTDT